jgi:methylated-DNA-protein-cysteine methyltransferase-like protein
LKTRALSKNSEIKIPVKRQYDFFEDVYEVVRLIPKGRVTTYGAIANYLGVKSSARMVGWAMNSVPKVTPAIPAHRVVNRNGMLTGKTHFNPPTLMEDLLKKEKIMVEKDTIQNFKIIFWDPAIELQID